MPDSMGKSCFWDNRPFAFLGWVMNIDCDLWDTNKEETSRAELESSWLLDLFNDNKSSKEAISVILQRRKLAEQNLQPA